MGVLELNLMKWIQEIALSVGMLIAFGLVLYYRYPRISRGLNKIFKLGSKKKSKDTDKKVEYDDEEIIWLIEGLIKRYKKVETFKPEDVIKRIKEIVG